MGKEKTIEVMEQVENSRHQMSCFLLVKSDSDKVILILANTAHLGCELLKFQHINYTSFGGKG